MYARICAQKAYPRTPCTYTCYVPVLSLWHHGQRVGQESRKLFQAFAATFTCAAVACTRCCCSAAPRATTGQLLRKGEGCRMENCGGCSSKSAKSSSDMSSSSNSAASAVVIRSSVLSVGSRSTCTHSGRGCRGCRLLKDASSAARAFPLLLLLLPSPLLLLLLKAAACSGASALCTPA